MRQIRENPESSNLLLLDNPLACDSQQRYLELLKSIARGNQKALASLYQETSPILFGLILRIIANRPLAEEVLLEVFKQVYRQAAAYTAQQGEPLIWMLKIARIRALACLRSGAAANEVQNLSLPEPQPYTLSLEPEKASPFSSQQRLVRTALASLSSPQREVIELAYFCGLTPDEIASRLELSSDTVQKHIRFAMMRLHEFLRPNLQEQL
jgi:RNA polymerase sigma-70 factor (ECF subfamily)